MLCKDLQQVNIPAGLSCAVVSARVAIPAGADQACCPHLQKHTIILVSCGRNTMGHALAMPKLKDLRAKQTTSDSRPGRS